MIDRRRLVAPKSQTGLLIEPPPVAVPGLLASPPRTVSILDRPLREWRESLRGRLGLFGPVIASGHQVEFFHAGVLAKLLLVDALSKRLSAAPVYVVVDSDVSKQTGVEVPIATPDGWLRRRIAIPAADGRTPTELLGDVPAAGWRAFFDSLSSLAPTDTLACFAEAATPQSGGRSLGDGLLAGVAAVCERLSVRAPRVVLVSELAETAEFRAFAAELMFGARATAQAFNSAQSAYRLRHGVRAIGRPVPRLAISAELVEAPFWLVRRGEPDRRRVFVGQNAGRVRLMADENVVGDWSAGSVAELAAALDGGLSDGWMLRPRALTLSAFLRYFVADLFVHGIGGAKYDELTDEFFAERLGSAPPPILCTTASVFMPGFENLPVGAGDEARRLERELWYNPQRVLPSPAADLVGQRSRLVAQSTALARAERIDRGARWRVFVGIREVNERMRKADAAGVAIVRAAIAAARRAAGDRAVASNREYFFGLMPLALLDRLSQEIRAESAI